MYRRFYQFTQKPFDVTPDPKFLYMSRNHQETLASIIYGIRERKGFIAVIGEVGTGKTTLLNAALESLDKNTKSAFIFNTDVTFEELLMTVLIDLGIVKTNNALPKYAALDRLNKYATGQFASGNNIVVFIDEAQNLTTRTMENLRLLSNLETTQYKLIQIVLSGQPELDEKLRKNELRQLAQRINLRRYITPLSKTDTYNYIQHYLNIAGYPGKKLFTNDSLRLIWKFSEGVPRKINILCDNALLIGYGMEKSIISKSIVKEAIKDLSWSPYVHHKNKVQRRKEPKPLTFRKLFKRFAYVSIILILGFFIGAVAWQQRQIIPGFLERLPHLARQIWNTKQEMHPVSSPPAAEEENNSDTHTISPKLTSSVYRQTRQQTPEATGKVNASDRIFSSNGTESIGLSSPPTDHVPAAALNIPTTNPVSDVVVKYGDTLSWIVQQEYGEYKNMLPKVIQANPQLQNPNLIVPGQIIRMPRTENP